MNISKNSERCPAYGYKDITIVPEKTTRVMSRSQVIPYDENLMLPIFAAPMDSVIDEGNWLTFVKNEINPVVPRSVKYEDRIKALFHQGYKAEYAFVAFSMGEANDTFLDEYSPNYIYIAKKLLELDALGYKRKLRICIDVANGHMQCLLDLIGKIKGKYGERILVMSGNIANPETYREYESVGCDYVRVSIGSGEGCSTTTKTGVHYPIFSLLEETYRIKTEINGKCKIIADGGIREFGDIQKALIYADYVMIGGLFSQMYEASGQMYVDKVYKKKYPREIENKFLTSIHRNKLVDSKDLYRREMWEQGKISYYRLFKGMSTKEAQKIIGEASGLGLSTKIKESEGFIKRLPVLYDLQSWVQEEEAALRSALSYTDSFSLQEYKDSNWIVNAQRNYN